MNEQLNPEKEVSIYHRTSSESTTLFQRNKGKRKVKSMFKLKSRNRSPIGIWDEFTSNQNRVRGGIYLISGIWDEFTSNQNRVRGGIYLISAVAFTSFLGKRSESYVMNKTKSMFDFFIDFFIYSRDIQ